MRRLWNMSQTKLCDQWRQTLQTYNLWTSLYSLRQSCMISGGRRYKHTTCEPHSTVSERAVWSVEADDTNTQLVNLTQQSQKELYDQWRQTIQTYNLWTSLYSLRQSCMISGGRRYKHTTCEPHSTVRQSCMISGGRRYKHNNLWTSLIQSQSQQSCMISGGRRYKHTTCEPHSTVSDRARAVWSVEADDTNIQLVNLTLQSQTELYDQWRQTIQTYNLWTSLNSLRKSCMISGGRRSVDRNKHTTCEPHSTVSERAVWSVEADDTNIQLVNLTLQSDRAVWSVEADDTNIQLVNLTLQWRQTIQTHNLWTSLNSLRKSCMISGGRRYKHTTCEPHSTVSDRAVWSVEADDTNIQLVNLTLQSQTELYDQWRQTIQTYNLWTSLYSLRQSCMISGGRRYKHTTCEPHSTVSDRAVWSVETDDTNTQLVNLTLQSDRAVWSVEADDTNTQLVNLTQQSQKELYDQWRQTIQTYNLWTSLYSLRQSCMISGGRRYKHTTCEPHSTVSDRTVWSVEADDTNIQLVNLTLQSQTELYDQWRQTIQTHNLWTSLYSLRQSCMISGGRRYKHTTCEPQSTVSERAVWSVEADDTNIQLVNLTQQSQKELYDQWRQTIQTYNLWTSLYSLRQSCMISGGRRYKHTTCEPHSTVSDRAVWSVEADDTNIQLVNLTLQSQKELYDQWRQTIQTYNLWTSLNSLRQSCMISGGRRYKHTTCKPHSTVSGRAVWSVEADDTNIQLVKPHSTVSDRAVWSVEADDTNIQLVNLTQQSQKELYDQWRQTIQTYNLWTSLNSLRKRCMIIGGRRYKHTTCEPHSTVSERAVWSVEADDTNIQLVNLTLQSQAELYDQWRQTIQTYNLWTSLNSLRKELYDQWRQTTQTYNL